LTIGTPSLASFLIAASSHLSAGGSGVVLVVLEVVVGVRVEGWCSHRPATRPPSPSCRRRRARCRCTGTSPGQLPGERERRRV